jgi:glycosyltransferase involved in cell wall biosynthesis
VVTLASGLRTLGHRVMVHTWDADAAMARDLGVELNLLPPRRFPRKLQPWYFCRQIERERMRLDGLQIAMTRVPCRDLVICGGTHRGYLRRARRWMGPFDQLQIWLETRAYQSAHSIVAVSNLCRREILRDYGMEPEKVTTVHPPVDGIFTPVTDDAVRAGLRRRFGFKDQEVVFLFPSTGHRRKGLGPICRALAGLSDKIVLAVAGRPPRGPMPAQVRFLGYLDDMAAAYQAVDFTILGSSYEPFGLVGPESILCGTRLVFDDSAGCLEVIKSEAVQKFSVWEVDSIRRAIQEAVALTRGGGHRLEGADAHLNYDPSPTVHAERIVELASRRHAGKPCQTTPSRPATARSAKAPPHALSLAPHSSLLAKGGLLHWTGSNGHGAI